MEVSSIYQHKNASKKITIIHAFIHYYVRITPNYMFINRTQKKAFNIVIRNLHSIIKNANITEDLNNKDFSVRQIINIHNCQTKISLHLFLFT